jgi:hypothetical protein
MPVAVLETAGQARAELARIIRETSSELGIAGAGITTVHHLSPSSGSEGDKC